MNNDLFDLLNEDFIKELRATGAPDEIIKVALAFSAIPIGFGDYKERVLVQLQSMKETLASMSREQREELVANMRAAYDGDKLDDKYNQFIETGILY